MPTSPLPEQPTWQDLANRGGHVLAWCDHCRQGWRIEPEEWGRTVGMDQPISQAEARLRCRQCGRPGRFKLVDLPGPS